MDVTGITPGFDARRGAILPFFDKDFSGTLDEIEIDFMSKTDIKEAVMGDYLTLSTPEGEITYKNIENDRGEEYYQTGSIPVAVVDSFPKTADAHGNVVSNIIKEENPDLQVSRFDVDTAYPYNPLQKMIFALGNKVESSQQAVEFLGNHPFINNLYENLGRLIRPENKDEKSIELALDQVLEQMKNGKEFKAVNLSQGIWCNYEDINSLLGKEIEQGGRIGEAITPENAAKYKTEIKQILRELVAQDENITYEDGRYHHQAKVKDILSVIDKMEELKIPIYTAQSYLSSKPETRGAQTFNWLSLADNAKTVESGKIVDGKVNSPYVSTSSFALDENRKRRIEAPLHYDGHSFAYGSSSFATPMALAHELKAQNEEN